MFRLLPRAALFPLLLSIAVRTNGFAQQKQDDSRTAIARAEEYFSNGNFTSAVYLLDGVLKKNPRHVNALTLLGRAYLAVKQVQEAERFFQRALEVDGKNADANLGMSLILLLDAKLESAKQHALAALSDESTRVDALNLLGQIAANQKKDYDQAIAFAKEDEQQNSTQAEGHYLLGILYQLKKEQDNANDEFVEVAAIIKQNPKASLAFNLDLFFPPPGKP